MRCSGAATCVLLGAAIIASGCASSAVTKAKVSRDLSGVVSSAGVDAARSALLVVRLADKAEWRSGGERIERPYPPASTAKIPHTLIALETGYAKGPEAFFRWDGQARQFVVWNQDHTLASAYRHSAVWVYQQIARDIGHEAMSEWLEKFRYGNARIGSPEKLTSYWLLGPLETSVRDQVEFLSALAMNALPLAPRTMRVGKQIMLAEAGENWKLYAKSGWRMDGVNTDIGWYVGWVDQRDHDGLHTCVFAFNMDMSEAADRARRQLVVRSALRQLGVAVN